MPRYLEREDLKAFPKASIVLLRPSMSFMLMNTPEPLSLKEALPNFSTTTHVFLPINDNADVTAAEGGSHWSLLLVSVIDGVAFHYDSMAASNDREARSTTIKMEQLLGKRLRFIPMHDSPQQENGSDCGVFVCVLMKHLLLKRLLKADASRKISMSMKDAHIDARDGRKQMLKVIEDRKKEGERRRSYVLRAQHFVRAIMLTVLQTQSFTISISLYTIKEPSSYRRRAGRGEATLIIYDGAMPPLPHALATENRIPRLLRTLYRGTRCDYNRRFSVTAAPLWLFSFERVLRVAHHFLVLRKWVGNTSITQTPNATLQVMCSMHIIDMYDI